jgi:hypothetical protein
MEIVDHDARDWFDRIQQADLILGRSVVSTQLVKTVHVLGKKFIYELDGLAPFFPEEGQRLSGNSLQEYEREGGALMETIKLCDGVMVSTSQLAEWVKTFYAGRVDLWENWMDFEWWEDLEVPEVKKSVKEVRMGCLGMASHALDVAKIVVPMMRGLEGRGVKLYVSAVLKRAIPKDLVVRCVFVKPWTMEARPLLARRWGLDVMLVPVVDNRFNRAKSAIKYFENAADRIPGVYSPVVYGAYVTHRETGLIATSVKEWVEAVKLVLADAGLRERMISRAYDEVRSRYNVAKHYEEWQRVLERYLE